jgi:hypothetical protein
MHASQQQTDAAGGLTVQDSARRGVGLIPGEVYSVRVSRVDERQVELEFSDRCLVADTPYRFRLGDRIALRLVGSNSGQLSFQLAVPAMQKQQAAEHLATFARAAGIPRHPASLAALGQLLELQLPVHCESAADMQALQAQGCPLGTAFAADLRRIWAAGQRPSVSMLACLGHQHADSLSLCAVLRRLPPLPLQFLNGQRTANIADYAVAGTGAGQHSARSIGQILRLLYSDADDPRNISNVIPRKLIESSAPLSQLLELLAMQRLLATLDSPHQKYILPMAGRQTDIDVLVDLRPLGRSGYLPRYSCHVKLEDAGENGTELQFVSEGTDCRMALLRGNPDWIWQLLETTLPRDEGPARDWPICRPGSTLARPDYPGFSGRLPHSLLEGLARLGQVLYERC